LYNKKLSELMEKTRQCPEYEEKVQMLEEAVEEKTKGLDLLIETFHTDQRMRIILSERLFETAGKYEFEFRNALAALAFLHEDINAEHSRAVLIECGLREEYEKLKCAFTSVKNGNPILLGLFHGATIYLREMLGTD
jgi:hypothetical protein